MNNISHEINDALGYYDIQSITIINNGSSNGIVCIQCNYITGADSTGCIVSLSNSNITVYNIAINRDDVIGCIDDVIAGLYSVVVNKMVLLQWLMVWEKRVYYWDIHKCHIPVVLVRPLPHHHYLQVQCTIVHTYNDYCSIVGTVPAMAEPVHDTSITTTILGNRASVPIQYKTIVNRLCISCYYDIYYFSTCDMIMIVLTFFPLAAIFGAFLMISLTINIIIFVMYCHNKSKLTI